MKKLDCYDILIRCYQILFVVIIILAICGIEYSKHRANIRSHLIDKFIQEIK